MTNGKMSTYQKIKVIKKIIKEEEITPAFSPKVFFTRIGKVKHRYYSPGKWNGEKIFFYVLLKNDPISRNHFLNEINFALMIKKSQKLRTLQEYVPYYLKIANRKLKNPWIITKYIPFPVLEDKNNAEKSIFLPEQKQIKKLAKFIYQLNSLKLKSSTNKTFEKNSPNFSRRYELLKILLEKNYKKGLLSSSENEKIKEQVKENKRLFIENSDHLVHGDFHLGNIILQKQNRQYLKIIDWEDCHLNNLAYDISFLFSRLWREKTIRNKLITNYIRLIPSQREENKFKKLFKMNIIWFSVNYGLRSKPLEFNKKQIAERQKWFKIILRLAAGNFNKYQEI